MVVPKRRCLLCRQLGGNPLAKASGEKICSVFGLPIDHSFKDVFGRGQYCDICLKEVKQAESLLTELEKIRQGLLRFQSKVYSLLEDNYFQIEARDKLTISSDIFDAGGIALKGRKFGYDEIVKVLYEKLRNNCFSWNTFASAASTERISPASAKSDSSTQTDVEELVPPLPPSSPPPPVENDTHDDYVEDSQTNPEDNEDLPDENDLIGDNSNPFPPDTSSEPNETSTQPLPDLPFFKTEVDLNNRIYCTVDPQNCSRFFFDSYNLKVHELSFHQNVELPYICPDCNRAFANIRRLRNHYLRVHTDLCSFLCPECGKGFATKLALQEHNSCHVKQRQRPDDLCFHCGLKLPSLEERVAHEELHRINPIPFVCLLCPTRAFPSTVSLKGHVAQVHRPKDFPCTLCGKLLASELLLGYHIKKHLGSFACEMCGFQCGSSYALKAHQLKKHTTEKAFTCEVCGKGFSAPKDLKIHMKTHTDERPYKCLTCGRGFIASNNLKIHEEIHLKDCLYECKVCGKNFKTRNVFYSHRNKHKPGYVPKKKKPETEAQQIKRNERQRARRAAAKKQTLEKIAENKGRTGRRRRRKAESNEEWS